MSMKVSFVLPDTITEQEKGMLNILLSDAIYAFLGARKNPEAYVRQNYPTENDQELQFWDKVDQVERRVDLAEKIKPHILNLCIVESVDGE
jgi:hypothetical protein